MSTSARELKRRVTFLQRNLVRGKLATEEDVKSVASRFKGKHDKDSLWEHWAELKVLAMSRMVDRRRKIKVTGDSLNVAIDALKEQPITVNLPSVGRSVSIHPASWERIQAIEDHEWWINRLLVARAVLMSHASQGIPDVASPTDECPECHRPRRPGKLAGLLADIRKEISYQRSMLFAHVVSPNPAPVTKGVTWADKLTAIEEEALKEAYHRVNYDIIHNLPSPRSERDDSALPHSWAFLFTAMEDRQRKPALHFMRDRSLGSVVAYLVLQEIKEQSIKDKVKSGSNKASGARDNAAPMVTPSRRIR
jgi:hypothetical protein